MSGVFREATLRAFEDASASIVLRGIDRAFERAGISLGTIASDEGGTRRVQFRRYVASVDQADPQQRDRLGDALGALVADVADSKVAFLVSAAERDGFVYVDGAFRIVATTRASFAISRVEDLASIDDRGRRLRVLAGESPSDAVVGAMSLVRSVCAIASSRDADSSAASVGLAEVVAATLASRRVASTDGTGGELARSLARLCVDLERSEGSRDAGSAPHARLAVDAAVALATFVAEAFAIDSKTR